MQECPGRIEIAKFRTQQNPDSQNQELAAHLATCPKCQSVLNEFEQNDSVFNQNKARMWEGLEQKFDEIDQGRTQPSEQEGLPPGPVSVPHKSYARIISIAGGLAAAAAVALMFFWYTTAPQGAQVEESFRYKGSVNFVVFAKRSEDQFKVEPGAKLMDGDEIRFVVKTDSAGYIDVFSVDTAGTVTPFYPDSNPANNPEPWWIAKSGRHELPGGITLDDILGQEHFVVVYSTDKFERAPILKLVEQSLREGTSLDNDTLLKENNIGIRTLSVTKVPRQ